MAASNEISVAEGRKLLASGKARLKNDRAPRPNVSAGEEKLLEQITQLGLPPPCPQYPFHIPGRRGVFHFDYGWGPQPRPGFVSYPFFVCAEVEGGTGEGHNRMIMHHVSPTGYAHDLVKYSEAAIAGWLVVRGTTEQVFSGVLIGFVERALRVRGLPHVYPPKRATQAATARPRGSHNGR